MQSLSNRAKQVEKKPFTLMERAYLPAIFQGLSITMRHFFMKKATVRFDGDRIEQIELQPFELRETGELLTHCTPQPVHGEKAERILTRLGEMSRPYGTIIERRGDIGIVSLG